MFSTFYKKWPVTYIITKRFSTNLQNVNIKLPYRYLIDNIKKNID